MAPGLGCACDMSGLTQDAYSMTGWAVTQRRAGLRTCILTRCSDPLPKAALKAYARARVTCRESAPLVRRSHQALGESIGVWQGGHKVLGLPLQSVSGWGQVGRCPGISLPHGLLHAMVADL